MEKPEVKDPTKRVLTLKMFLGRVADIHKI
jgi:hypothetical protein